MENLKTRLVTVTEITHSHYPDYASFSEIAVGMTLRQALLELRKAGRDNCGDMGTMTAELSDGTQLEIELQCASDNGWELSSQRIVRRTWDRQAGRDRTIRIYPW